MDINIKEKMQVSFKNKATLFHYSNLQSSDLRPMIFYEGFRVPSLISAISPFVAF